MTGPTSADPGDPALSAPADAFRPTSEIGPVGRRPVGSVVEVAVPAGSSFAVVARLVLAGLGARMGLRVSEIEELQRGLDVLLGQPAACDEMTIRLTPSVHGLEMDVGPFDLRPVERAWLERVLSGLVEEIRWRDAAEERGEWISTRMRRRSVDLARR